MSLGKFLTSRAFIKHLSLALGIAIVLVLITLISLNYYTRHGISYPVPNLTGLTIEEATESAQANRLSVVIIDSVFNSNFAPGKVVDQQPLVNSRVKENRKIFLTINSTQPEKITLPRLTDISFRQAQVLIEKLGLFIEEIEYQPSEYDDLVLKITQNSEEVFEGDKLIKGTQINIVVGRNKGNQKTSLPNLTGFTLQEAELTLTDARLNQGVLLYDTSIKTASDSLKAKIWKQLPNPKYVSQVDLGSSVDLWLTTDTLKLNNAYERQY